MMPATPMLMDARVPIRQQAPVTAAAIPADFAGILESSGMAAAAAVSEPIALGVTEFSSPDSAVIDPGSASAASPVALADIVAAPAAEQFAPRSQGAEKSAPDAPDAPDAIVSLAAAFSLVRSEHLPSAFLPIAVQPENALAAARDIQMAVPSGAAAIAPSFAQHGSKPSSPRNPQLTGSSELPTALRVESQLPLLPAASWPSFAEGAVAALADGVTDMLSLAQGGLAAAATPAAPPLAASIGDPPMRLLDLGDDNRWVASLAQDIAALNGDDGLLRFQLLPRHLGRIDVTLQTGSDGVSVHIAAENSSAQAMLAAAQPRLVDELRQNGIRIAAADVAMQANGSAQDRREQDRPHHDQRWNFVETGHAADPVPGRAGRSGVDRLA